MSELFQRDLLKKMPPIIIIIYFFCVLNTLTELVSFAFGIYLPYNNNNNNNNNNIDPCIAHFYPQCALHYESRLKINTN